MMTTRVTSHRSGSGGLTRRQFGRLLAASGSAAVSADALGEVGWATGGSTRPSPARLPEPPASADERYWAQVRDQFAMPRDLAVMNAANLCPSPVSVIEATCAHTRDIDRDPSPINRRKMGQGKETTRRLLADFLRVTPEEIVITRNTSESNNLVSSGLDLKAGDEVVIFSDNHPSNHVAWREKGKRFGFTVRVVDQINPHPGAEYYLDAFTKAMTARTKVLAFTHLTNSAGDVLPAKELCRLARERGVLSLVDGAQSFGLMDVDLSDVQPDFYTGSAHKWPCGPKETGVLYINTRAQSALWPSVISLYPGMVGISKTLEAFGQRDEPAILAFGEALTFQTEIGRKRIEDRARELAQALMDGLRTIEGVKLWTHRDPARSLAVVSFLPGNLDPQKLAAALYERDRIVCATRGGVDRTGLRFSPHLYNSHVEVERTVAAVKRYMAAGI